MPTRLKTKPCPACDASGTEYGPGDVIPGWCTLCHGKGRVSIDEWEAYWEAVRLEQDEERDA